MGHGSIHHVPHAYLQAYAAGEIDAVQRGAIEAHLSTCADCRRTLENVQAMRGLFQEMQPRELDELRWRRIGNAVLAQLEQDAIARHRNGKRNDRLSLFLWGTAGIAAAAALIFALWGPWSNAPEDPSKAETRALTAGVRPPPGVYFHISDDARIRARSTPPGLIDLELELGTLDVRALTPVDPPPSIVVWTPSFQAVARSSDFTIAYTASGASVEVRQGEVDVHAADSGERTTVKAGERRVVPRAEEHAARTPARAEAEPELATKTAAAPAGLGAGKAKPSVTHAATEQRLPAQKAEERSRTSSEGETRVSVEVAPVDPIAEKWAAATRAYYQERDLPRAISAAEEIVATHRVRPEVLSAQEMLCDGYFQMRDGMKAVAACKVLLERAEASRREERARAIHYQLATIYRTLLADCASAMDHYGKAIVFGRESELDEDAMRWRAHCALEVGDVDAARRDILMLQRRESALAQPGMLRDLERRFDALIESKSPGSEPRSRGPQTDSPK